MSSGLLWRARTEGGCLVTFSVCVEGLRRPARTEGGCLVTFFVCVEGLWRPARTEGGCLMTFFVCRGRSMAAPSGLFGFVVEGVWRQCALVVKPVEGLWRPPADCSALLWKEYGASVLW